MSARLNAHSNEEEGGVFCTVSHSRFVFSFTWVEWVRKTARSNSRLVCWAPRSSWNTQGRALLGIYWMANLCKFRVNVIKIHSPVMVKSRDLESNYNSTLTSFFSCVLTEGAWMMQCSVIIMPYKAICNGFLFIHSTFCEQLLCTSLWAKELKYLVSDFTIYMYFPPKSFAFKMTNPLSFSAECIHCLHWNVSWWRLHFLCVKLCRVKYLVSGISKWTHLSKIWILKSVINLLQVKEWEVFWLFSF